MATLIALVVVALVVLVTLSRGIRIVPQARAGSWSGSAATTARSTPGSRSWSRTWTASSR